MITIIDYEAGNIRSVEAASWKKVILRRCPKCGKVAFLSLEKVRNTTGEAK